MLCKTTVFILFIALLLAPLKFLKAQETSSKGCSALTEIDDSGKIIWSTSADVSAVVADIQMLDIPAAEFHSLCNDNLPTEQATSEQPKAQTGEADASSTTASTTAPATSAAAAR